MYTSYLLCMQYGGQQRKRIKKAYIHKYEYNNEWIMKENIGQYKLKPQTGVLHPMTLGHENYKYDLKYKVIEKREIEKVER